MNRAKLIMELTNLELQVDQLEVSKIRLGNSTNIDAINEQLYEVRQEIRRVKEQLRVVDEQWIAKQEHTVEILKRNAETTSPGDSLMLDGEIQDYIKRIEDRKKSMQKYG